MNINSLIISTLEPVIPNNDSKVPQPSNVVPGTYKGKSTIYCTFNYEDDRGEVFTDDLPEIDIASIQVHLFVPLTYNHIALKKRTRVKLLNAGFSYPQITELIETDTEKRHIIFQCEIDGQSETEE